MMLLLDRSDQPQDLRLRRDVEAVVGSSAISSAGSSAKAAAIMTRCRCPPDSW